jgi:hypothetical protein
MTMATLANDSAHHSHRLGVLRVALTGTLAAPIFYALCWVGAQLLTGPATHMYLELFTKAELSSATALIEGVCWSIAFGLTAGALMGSDL